MFEVVHISLQTPAIHSHWDEVLQLILSILELGGTHEDCDTLLLLKLVVKIVVLHRMFLKSLFTESFMSKGI